MNFELRHCANAFSKTNDEGKFNDDLEKYSDEFIEYILKIFNLFWNNFKTNF
jgi:hypothetical protein